MDDSIFVDLVNALLVYEKDDKDNKDKEAPRKGKESSREKESPKDEKEKDSESSKAEVKTEKTNDSKDSSKESGKFPSMHIFSVS